jgi:hypothetical protein
VRVRAEAGAALDAVFVYDAQGPEVFVFGVVVAGEAEGVEGVEPAWRSVLVVLMIGWELMDENVPWSAWPRPFQGRFWILRGGAELANERVLVVLEKAAVWVLGSCFKKAFFNGL